MRKDISVTDRVQIKDNWKHIMPDVIFKSGQSDYDPWQQAVSAL